MDKLVQRAEKCAKILKGYQCEAMKWNTTLLPFCAYNRKTKEKNNVKWIF